MIPLVPLIFTATLLLSLFSTAILSYLSMAVMIGPWIEPTVGLIAMMLVTLCARSYAITTKINAITAITIGSSIGGILATACGFAFPTLYFLDQTLFTQWLQSPLYFVVVMAGLSLTAGSLGFLLANFFEDKLINVEQMPFPIGQMAYKMISAQNNIKKAGQLIIGFFLSSIYSFIQYLLIISRQITVFPGQCFTWFEIPSIKLPLGELPILWAIGFVTGHVVAVPLLIGIIAKILILTPTHKCFFTYLKPIDFSFAFASGMVFYGACMSLFELPKLLYDVFGKWKKQKNTGNFSFSSFSFNQIAQWIIVLIGICLFLSYFNFSFLSQIYLVFFTILCTYQLLIIGGKIGIAPLARFATFVMMPGLVVFGFNAVQITIVSTFVELCGGVAVDVLFGRKMAQLSNLDRKGAIIIQWLGLLISSLSVGFFFWLLISKFGLGSSQLLAQRSQTRALTVSVHTFDFFALILGALFGSILKDFKISPIMVLGGILMPLDWSIILMLSGFSTYLVKEKEEQYPFWSGIFAANSLWMIVQALW